MKTWSCFLTIPKETFFTPEALSQGNYPFFPDLILQAHGLNGCRSRSFWLNDMDGLEKAEAAMGLAYFRFQYNFLLSIFYLILSYPEDVDSMLYM
ncbi:hypothetical protein BGV40_05795 [Methanosarcina sp. Ant1]|nr:hypothetical protein BGV40_05795 [Methanosarcina sp. Ant1]